MVNVQPGFYEGVDGYEQAWSVDIISDVMNDIFYYVLIIFIEEILSNNSDILS